MKTSTAFPRWALLILALALPSALWASVGKVVIAAGDVYAVSTDNEQRPLRRRSDVFEGDTLITGADGKLQLRFNDNAIMALRADSELVISEYQGAREGTDEQVLMDLLAGGFRTITGSIGSTDRDAYRVRTPNASIGIRGTHYEAVYQTETLSVGVYDGGITLSNDQGSIDLGLDSEFVYAQVQAGNFPEGLLNPPDNLNQPNTPETGDGGDGGEETEDDGENDGNNNEEDGDDGISLDDWNGDTDEPPPIPDGDEISEDDFNFSALEDDFEELQASSVDLTLAETAAVKDSPSTGVLVMSPSASGDDGALISPNGPIIVHAAETTENQQSSPFFVAYAEQSGTELDDSYRPPNFVIRPSSDSVKVSNEDFGGLSIGWEEWNLTNDYDDEATAAEVSNFNSGTLDTPFFFITAEPTQAELSGTRDFTLSHLVASNYSDPFFDPNPSANTMESNFNTGATTGNLTFSDTSDMVEVWSLDFEGNVNGSALDATLTDSSSLSITYPQNEMGEYDINGNVNGIFSDGPNSTLQFVGGFSAQSPGSPEESETYGVFVMEEPQ